MSKYQWCLLCERATKKMVPEKDSDSRCPTPGCDGVVGNIWDWDSLRQGREDLPSLPEEGKVYTLSARENK